ncbi:MAG: SPFH domain-containing protein [Candidatus Njordarchaeia archaeon]
MKAGTSLLPLQEPGPGMITIIVVLIIFLVILIIAFIRSRYKIFPTNVYVIHFRRGRVKKAGLGGSYIILPVFDKLATIPTVAQKVDISAERVISKENQEVIIHGFVVWSVVEPEKTFSNVQWENISPYIKDITESVIRTTSANMPLIDILREREKIVKAIVSELDKIVSDWGIKIDTVEIREVEVVDKELFANLQAEMFWNQWRSAQELKIQSEMKAGILQQEKELQVGMKEREKEMKLKEQEVKIAELEAQKEKARKIVEAEAEKQSLIVRAQGEAEANYLKLKKEAEGLMELAKAVNDDIIRYELATKLPEIADKLKQSFDRAVFIGNSEGLGNFVQGIAAAAYTLTDALRSNRLPTLKVSDNPSGKEEDNKKDNEEGEEKK